MEKHIVKEKSFEFPLKIIDLSRIIKTRHREYDLTRQMKRSGTAIGAMI
jgi:four helix bundle protein